MPKIKTNHPWYDTNLSTKVSGFVHSVEQLVVNDAPVSEPLQEAPTPDCCRVSVDVSNAGDRDGDEVVQLYISDVEASVPVPQLHLEGFRRIHLKAGKTQTVMFELKPRQFVCYDGNGNPAIEPGEFRIFVGGGQPDDPDSNSVQTTMSVATQENVSQ